MSRNLFDELELIRGRRSRLFTPVIIVVGIATTYPL